MEKNGEGRERFRLKKSNDKKERKGGRVIERLEEFIGRIGKKVGNLEKLERRTTEGKRIKEQKKRKQGRRTEGWKKTEEEKGNLKIGRGLRTA